MKNCFRWYPKRNKDLNIIVATYLFIFSKSNPQNKHNVVLSIIGIVTKSFGSGLVVTFMITINAFIDNAVECEFIFISRIV